MKYIIAAIIGLLLAGCFSRGSVPPVAPTTVSAHFGNIGEYFLWVGALALGLGVALRFIGIFASTTPLGRIARFVPASLAWSIGVAGVSVGASFVWLGNHPWLFGAVCVLTALAVAVHHWTDIRRWFYAGSDTTAIIHKK